MNISNIKNVIGPFEAVTPLELAKVTAINERQDLPARGNESPPSAPAVNLQEQLVQAADIISELVQNLNIDSDLQFQVDDSTGANVITVLDGETGAVIRRFPTEESLAIARYIAEFSEAPRIGLLTDQVE